MQEQPQLESPERQERMRQEPQRPRLHPSLESPPEYPWSTPALLPEQQGLGRTPVLLAQQEAQLPQPREPRVLAPPQNLRRERRPQPPLSEHGFLLKYLL
jgi:hypothetical protein